VQLAVDLTAVRDYATAAIVQKAIDRFSLWQLTHEQAFEAGLFVALGFEHVKVVFEEPPRT
jgi:hypothetical protein